MPLKYLFDTGLTNGRFDWKKDYTIREWEYCNLWTKFQFRKDNAKENKEKFKNCYMLVRPTFSFITTVFYFLYFCNYKLSWNKKAWRWLNYFLLISSSLPGHRGGSLPQWALAVLPAAFVLSRPLILSSAARIRSPMTAGLAGRRCPLKSLLRERSSFSTRSISSPTWTSLSGIAISTALH